MSFRSLRLPALMAGAAAAVVSFATPSFAWRSHARHYYRTPHHVVVHGTVYRPAPARSTGAIYVCRACSEAWRWKSSAQPDDGEGLARLRGFGWNPRPSIKEIKALS